MSTVRRVAVAAAALAVGASLASCQYLASNYPDVPTTAPTATSTPAETDMQRQMRLDYAAAEKAYRNSSAAADKLVAKGATKPSKALEAVATGEFVDLIMDLAKQVHDADYTSTGHTVIRGVVTAGWQEKKVKLIACEDVSNVKLYDRDGKRVKGTNRTPYYVQHLTVVRTNASTWKVADLETTQVETLDGQPCADT